MSSSSFSDVVYADRCTKCNRILASNWKNFGVGRYCNNANCIPKPITVDRGDHYMIDNKERSYNDVKYNSEGNVDKFMNDLFGDDNDA